MSIYADIYILARLYAKYYVLISNKKGLTLRDFIMSKVFYISPSNDLFPFILEKWAIPLGIAHLFRQTLYSSTTSHPPGYDHPPSEDAALHPPNP